MFRASGIAIVAIAFFSSNPANAAEPGDPCSVAGGYTRSADADAAYHLVCDGSQWNLNLTLHKDGPVGIGTVNPSSGLTLDVEGKVGATDYCDENGENCFTTSDIGAGIFEVASNVVRPTSTAVNYATDDFLFGSPQLNDDGNEAHDSRMFFDKSKSAFRAGIVNDNGWDSGNVGSHSVAFGISTSASGFASTAFGSQAVSSGAYSVAGGLSVNATAGYSVAFGYQNTASGSSSVAFGRGNNPSGAYSTAIGQSNFAQGTHSLVLGYRAYASGNASISAGLHTAYQTSPPKITGARSMVLFMDGGVGNVNSNLNITGSDIFAIVGGRALIDPTRAEVDVTSGLALDVHGHIGAESYCDENGENCFTADSVGGGSAEAAGPEGAIQFNSSSALSGSSNFVYTDDGTVELISGSASAKGLIVKGSASQTANLQEWQNNSGTVLGFVDKSGNLTVEKQVLLKRSGITFGAFAEGAGVVAIHTPAHPHPGALYIQRQGVSGTSISGALGEAVPLTSTSDFGMLAIGGPGSFSGGWKYHTAIYKYNLITHLNRSDHTTYDFTIEGKPAFQNATTNLIGGDLYLKGGNGASASAGLATGGDVFIDGGIGYGTGIDGNLLLQTNQSGKVGIGTADPDYALDVVGDIAFTGDLQDVSDRRLKDSIESLPAGQLAKLTALQGVSFTMKGNDKTELGLIAQDVEPHFPELVQTRPDGTMTMSYLGFIAPLIEALKEQQSQIDALQQQIELLQSQQGETGSGPATGE